MDTWALGFEDPAPTSEIGVEEDPRLSTLRAYTPFRERLARTSTA